MSNAPIVKLEQEPEPRGELTTRTVAMPADTNPSGDIFGGWVMSQMDLAAGMCSGNVARCRTVTIAVDSMIFHKPVKVGDTLCVYTDITGIGRTSIKIHVEAWASRKSYGIREKVTEAQFTFVAIGEDGRPTPINSVNR